MTTINDAHINALLADAAYAENLVQASTPGLLTTTLSGRLTTQLATFVSSNFTVVTQASGYASSFDATAWRGNAGTAYAGQFYVSMRGTHEAFDFSANFDLSKSGLARRQLADMTNWWLRATTAQSARQVAVAPNGDFELAPSVQGTGTLVGIAAIKSVNGHSLGGYLASAFVRLFGAAWPLGLIGGLNNALSKLNRGCNHSANTRFLTA